MTRLLCGHIEHIGTVWSRYDQEFEKVCGQSLWRTALKTVGRAEAPAKPPLVGALSIEYGEGVIGGFAESLQSIADHLGFPAILAKEKNFPGWAELMGRDAEIILCSDDTFFGAFNLRNGKVGENSEATGLGYAQALLDMSADRSREPVHVIGAGPVGRAGASLLRQRGREVVIYDLDTSKAESLAASLAAKAGQPEELLEAQERGGLFLQAAPDPKALDWSLLDPRASKVVHPAVPLGLSLEEQKGRWGQSLWHDPLELGTAVMLAMAL